MAERGQWREKAEIERRAALRRRIEEFGEALPIPGDPTLQYLEWNSLDIDEIAGRDVARLGPARRDAYAAIAHDHRGHAVPQRRRDRRVPADLRVIMGVRVDKAGRDDAAGRIDDLACAVLHLADLGDLAVRDRDIGLTPRRPRAVDHRSVLDQQIIHCRGSLSLFSTVRRARGAVDCQERRDGLRGGVSHRPAPVRQPGAVARQYAPSAVPISRCRARTATPSAARVPATRKTLPTTRPGRPTAT